jgi:hypothetical protein
VHPETLCPFFVGHNLTLEFTRFQGPAQCHSVQPDSCAKHSEDVDAADVLAALEKGPEEFLVESLEAALRCGKARRLVGQPGTGLHRGEP